MRDEQAKTSIKETLGLMNQNQCAQMPLRERIASRLMRAEQDFNRNRRLQRFAELSDKHPDVMEMLELFRELDL